MELMEKVQLPPITINKYNCDDFLPASLKLANKKLPQFYLFIVVALQIVIAVKHSIYDKAARFLVLSRIIT